MDARAGQIIAFLRTTLIKDPGLPLAEDTPLLSSGLIDSFALVELLLAVERVTGRRIPRGKARPEHFETVREMLAMVERVGAAAAR
ncbi:MAG: acyl carrier protein [Candidatus Rokubacteria bacterium]|nr:acyl carrier protein [Candidatus Rokubacteria bacterium]